MALPRVRPVVPKPGMVRARIVRAADGQRIERLAQHEQGQGRIEAAGNADGDGRLADVFEPAGQAGDLGMKDLLAALAQLFLPRGTNGWASTSRSKRGPNFRSPTENGIDAIDSLQAPVREAASLKLVVRARLVRSRSTSTSAAMKQIVALKARRFGQKRAVLRDQAVAAEDEVLSRFAGARGGIDVAGDAAGRLIADQLPAISRLADRFVAGGKIGQDRRPMNALERTGRHGNPQVFADFDADDQAFDSSSAGEKQVDAEGDVFAADTDRPAVRGRRRGEEAGVVKLLVSGQIGLRNDAEDAPACDGRRTVEDLIVDQQRQARQAPGRRTCAIASITFRRASIAPSCSRLLEKEIVAGVAGQPHLGKDDNADAARLGQIEHGDRAFRVEAQSATRSNGLAAATRTKP